MTTSQAVWRVDPMRISLALALALALVAPSSRAQEEGEDEGASPTPAAKKPKAPQAGEKGKGFSLDLRGDVGAGGFKGYSVRKDAGATLNAELGAKAEWDLGALDLEVPVEIGHRQTFGAWLPETRGRAGIDSTLRLSRTLRGSLDVGASGAWRPGWADLYQPLGGGTYSPTGRYSYFSPDIDIQLASMPAKGHHLRGEYSYSRVDYVHDPNYDPYAEPMHIAPADHDLHELKLGWRWFAGAARVGASLDSFARFDRSLVARDAHTGLTHANPGGLPSNPKQLLAGTEPRLDLELDLGAFELDLRYGYEMVADTFEGYYSYAGHNPRVRLQFHPTDGITAKLGGEAWWREYGPNSYQAGGGHPPLEYGTRRVDHRFEASFTLEAKIVEHLWAFAEASWIWRDTNFPDYVPNVFPATRQYSIDWDYHNLAGVAGVSVRY